MSKSDRIRRLLARGLNVKEIAKRSGATVNLVHQVKWQDANKKKSAPKKAKKKAVFKSERSKIIQAVIQTKKALDSIEKKPTKIITHSQFAKDALDLVNNPPHYTDGGVDTLTYIEAKDLNYRLGNVIKYVSRAGKKTDSDPLQDLMKARFYLQREIDVRRDA